MMRGSYFQMFFLEQSELHLKLHSVNILFEKTLPILQNWVSTPV